MATYSVRCRHFACRWRQVVRTHPDDMQTVQCPQCHNTKGWRYEARAYNKRNLCHCSGPEASQEHGKNFPHQKTHPLCEHHPHGIYNQARARGIEHDDIPSEYRP